MKHKVQKLEVPIEGVLIKRKWNTHCHFLQQRMQICKKANECITRIESHDLQKYKYELGKEPPSLQKSLMKENFNEF